ncbi:TonB-dependent vitamin B12 receptor [Uliginosibacterium sp. sgz301328]|uniref:TonB-dependent vitamin B12 receptor n=1 Tax=Uliginosibacterium sp. sgz301328 TaxID=3243764 RepID=UPI00359E062C
MKYPLLPAAVLLGATQASMAQRAPQQLDPIIVTADRVARTADETLASVTVITREDIERQQAVSVPDALRGVPGVTLSNTGGRGKATSVFLRGTNSDHTLVLIDGMKIGSATTGAAALQDLPIELIDRIEVVRGPRASLYGSEAIGGVIQIFTRKGGTPDGGWRPTFSIGGGSRSTGEVAATAAVGTDKAWLNAGISADTTNGINACEGTSSGCFANEPDRDGYNNQSYNLRGGYRFSRSLDADVQFMQAHSNNEFDGGFQNHSTNVQQVASATLRYHPVDLWKSSLTVGQTQDRSKSYYYSDFASRFLTRTDQVSWQNDFAINNDHMVTVGLDYQNDHVSSDTAYTVTSRDNKAIFAQYLGSFGASDVQLSARNDDNEQFGNHATGSAAFGYTFSPALRLTANVGTAFKAPTFNQLYYPGYGTPDLKPEKSKSFELGASGKFAQTSNWSLNAYQTQVDDLIAGYPLANIAKARIRGVEATLGTQLAGTQFTLFATYVDPKDDSGGANDGKLLPRRPKQSARLDIDHDFGRWSLGGSLYGAGKSYDDAANKTKLGGYGTVDLRAEYELTKTWRVQGRIENLFDKRHQTAYYYNQPGFGAFITLRYAAL